MSEHADQITVGEELRSIKSAMQLHVEETQRVAKIAADAAERAEHRHADTMREIGIVKTALQGEVGKTGIVATIREHAKTLKVHNVIMFLFLAAFITEVVNLAIGHSVR